MTLASDLPSEQSAVCLRWVLTGFGLGLLVATRWLWVNFDDFPQVPWFAWGCAVPQVVDLCLVPVVAVSLVASSVTRPDSMSNRICMWLFAGSMIGLLLLDQHRFQPWVYQLVLVAIVLATARWQSAVGLLRLLTISIYFYSAVSKCDASFCTGLGRSFLVELTNLACGPQPAGAPFWQTGAWPVVFPVGELLIAVGLIWPVSRRSALWCATGMHLLLLVVLGPWGLRHSTGVLIWNGYFIAQNFILFGKARNSVNQPQADSVSIERTTPSQWIARLLIGWAVFWPCLEPWGVCDVWPAWGLYAQHGEQLTVRITDRGLQRLPVAWQETATRRLEAGEETWDWQLRPQPVSLRSVWAPLYPQNRFQLGVILDVAKNAGVEPEEVSAIWYFPANRWTGTRRSVQLNSLAELERMADRCWLNARPRK